MRFSVNRWRFGVGTLALAAFGLVAPQPASANICLTSGKVYVQQKVYDKACYFLECARKSDPENVDVLSLLAFARAQQRQYVSAGAAFQLGLDVAKKKKDDKRVQDLERNRLAVNAQLFNAGIKALQGAGGQEATADSTAPPYNGAAEPSVAVSDTTVFGPYTGASRLEEAAYDFELASYVDATSIETYQNLTYVLSQLGRTDDAIRAAKRGLLVKPGDQRLHNNLRAAVMSKALRLYQDGKYVESVSEFYNAMQNDPDPASAPGYQLRIADSWLKRAQELTKGSPEQKAAYDSAAVGFGGVLVMPAASDSLKQNAIYNEAVIYANQEKYADAISVLDKGGAAYPNNKDIWSLNGQVKYQSKDYKGAVVALRHALELDPTEAANHQFLFLSLHETGDKEGSVSEYAIYKALSDGTKKDQVKVWVDSAVNRLGTQTQTTGVLKSEGYPEEVYTYREESKVFETWFFWSKGKSFTFLDGQIFSKGAFPAKKSG